MEKQKEREKNYKIEFNEISEQIITNIIAGPETARIRQTLRVPYISLSPVIMSGAGSVM